MVSIIDRFIVFIISLISMYFYKGDLEMVIVILVAIFFSLFCQNFSKNYRVLGGIVYLIICYFNPEFVFLLPLIFYEFVLEKPVIFNFLFIIVAIINLFNYSSIVIFIILTNYILVTILKYKTIENLELKNKPESARLIFLKPFKNVENMV